VKIGLIQTRGIGDIIIALPIAQYLIRAGHEVYWPIDSRFMTSFQPAAPEIHWLAVEHPAPQQSPGGPLSYFLDDPLSQLRAAGCDAIHLLYSFLSDSPVARPDLRAHLKFDEYKYAVAGVPFAEKWHLRLRRDREREQQLFARVAPSGQYVAAHLEGSNAALPPAAVSAFTRDLPLVRISALTDNVFDWLTVIERAAALIMIDSCYSNLAEQLGIGTRKHLVLRSPALITPVYRNGWSFSTLGEPQLIR
jgi:hypothetical protein